MKRYEIEYKMEIFDTARHYGYYTASSEDDAKQQFKRQHPRFIYVSIKLL